MRVFLRRHGTIFCIGALGYCILELLWRQRTHWSMGIAGGVCLAGLKTLERRLKNRSLLPKCLAGSILITLVELLIGLWVNRIMGWGVWDYADQPLNLLGQICPLYSGLWFLLCMPIMKLFQWFREARGNAHGTLRLEKI